MENIIHLTADYQPLDFQFNADNFEALLSENDYQNWYHFEDMGSDATDFIDTVYYHSLLEGDDVLIDFNTQQHEAINLTAIFDELGIVEDEDIRTSMVELSASGQDTVLHIRHPQAVDFSITFLDTPYYALHIGQQDEIIVA